MGLVQITGTEEIVRAVMNVPDLNIVQSRVEPRGEGQRKVAAYASDDAIDAATALGAEVRSCCPPTGTSSTGSRSRAPSRSCGPSAGRRDQAPRHIRGSRYRSRQPRSGRRWPTCRRPSPRCAPWKRSRTRASRAARSTASRSRPTPRTPLTASRSSSTWVSTTPASGRPPSTRWSGRTATCR